MLTGEMSPREQTSARKHRFLAQWMGAQENPKADYYICEEIKFMQAFERFKWWDM